MFLYVGELNQVALLLILGIGFFCSAVFLANPFQHADAVAFYRAIHKHRTRYWRMNLLHTFAILALVGGFGLLARQTWRDDQPLIVLGLVLLVVATLLWLAQFWIRLTATTATANEVFRGVKPPVNFPDNIGAGFDRLFSAFQISLLIGIAAVLAGLGEAGMISPVMTRLGIVVLIASGVFATREYPWLGGVERALFYPMATVVVPLGLWFLMNGQ
jgi:uncharacterized membrane protein